MLMRQPVPAARNSPMILSLFRRNPANPPAKAAFDLRDLVKELDRVDTFPTLSDTVVRAMAMANNADATLADFTAVVRRDGSVTASVIKMANSAAFNTGTTVKDVHQAVVRLGLRRCFNLLSSIGMRNMFQQYSPDVQNRCEGLLRHSLFTANLASNLNKTLKAGFTGEEFTASLLHDIGRLIIIIKVPEGIIDYPTDAQEDEGVLDFERKFLGTDHCNLGSLFAIKNQLPAAISSAIFNHHRPHAEKDHRPLVGIVGLADHLANHIQFSHKLADYNPESSAAYQQLTPRWTEKYHVAFRWALKDIVVNSLAQTRAMLKSSGVKK